MTPAAAPPVIEAPPAEPVAPVYTMPKIEPEIIKQWREDFKLRTEKIEADANQEVKPLFNFQKTLNCHFWAHEKGLKFVALLWIISYDTDRI